MKRTVGYARVSTEDQDSGLEAQTVAIRAECERRGWNLVELFEDAGQSGDKSADARPGLRRALKALEHGGRCTGRAKVDRLSPSLLEFSDLIERARRRRWSIVLLDAGVDTSTPQGEMLIAVLAIFARFERRIISQRTREALAVRRAHRVRLGWQRLIPESVARRIAALRATGLSSARIAERLNRDHVPRALGGRRRYASTVQTVVRSRGTLEPIGIAASTDRGDAGNAP